MTKVYCKNCNYNNSGRRCIHPKNCLKFILTQEDSYEKTVEEIIRYVRYRDPSDGKISYPSQGSMNENNNCPYYSKITWLNLFIDIFSDTCTPRQPRKFLCTIYCDWNPNTGHWIISNIDKHEPCIPQWAGFNFNSSYSYSSGVNKYTTDEFIYLLDYRVSSPTVENRLKTRPIPEILEELDDAVDSREDTCT